MTAPHLSPLLLRAHQIAASIVPSHRREDWSREWQAELWQLCRKQPSHRPRPLNLASGMLRDALWLRADSIRITSPGSASLCLISLAACLLVIGVAEWFVSGSFHALGQTVKAHFLGNYLFIALPAIFAAIVTHPVRPMRLESSKKRRGLFSFEQLLSVRTRRAAFLTMRIALTLAIGFFAILFVLSPFHFAGRLIVGPAELFLDALTITASLRHIFLNQEQRCQRCLRTLGAPTRVGLQSQNFLSWSGTELTCNEGHGTLQIPAMRGSWCWYDRWVEDEWLLATLNS